MKRILFLQAILLTSISIAQNLPRKAFLGVRFSPLTEKFKKETNYKKNYGLLITEISRNGTIANLNISKGSVLIQINGKKVSSRLDFRKIMEHVKEGDTLLLNVLTNNKQEKLFEVIAKGKPYQKSTYGSVNYGAVKYKNNKLRSLLYLPNNNKKPPVVFYLQGYTCQSIEFQDNIPMKKLINDWVKNGYAVYLVEKPGVGDSFGEQKCLEIDFQQELKAFQIAYKNLIQNQQIDKDNIFLFGHSMGGVVAPLLAQIYQPKGIQVFGTVGKNIYPYMKDVFTEQQLLLGATKESIEQHTKLGLPFLKDLMVAKKTNEQILLNDNHVTFLKKEQFLEAFKKGYYENRKYTYWQALGEIDIPKAWSKITGDVFVMHGEYDVQAIHYKYAKLIATTVNSNKGKATFKLIPSTDHLFLKFSSMDENVKSLNNGSYRDAMLTRYNTKVSEISIAWMNQLVKE